LEKEQQSQVLQMEKAQLLNACLLKDQRIEYQNRRLTELEQLLREQYCVLKVNNLISESHARQYTTTTGEVILTPRRSPASWKDNYRLSSDNLELCTSPMGRSSASRRSNITSRRLSQPVSPLAVPIFPSSPLFHSTQDSAALLPPLEVEAEGDNNATQTIPYIQISMQSNSSPFSSPEKRQRPASILKRKASGSTNRTENLKRVTIVSPEPHSQQKAPRKRVRMQKDANEGTIDIRTPGSYHNHNAEASKGSTTRTGVMAPTLASLNRAKNRAQPQERRRSSPLQGTQARTNPPLMVEPKRLSAVYGGRPRGKENAAPTPTSFLRSGAVRQAGKKPSSNRLHVPPSGPTWHVTKD